MKNLLIITMLAAPFLCGFGATGICFSQEIPDGVKKIMEELQTDPDRDQGLKSAQKFLDVDSKLQLSDIAVGTPIEEYRLKKNILDTCKETDSIQTLIKSANRWYIPIKANGKFIYHVKVKIKDGLWKVFGSGTNDFGIWNKLQNDYPEESGVNPILIIHGKNFLYFPNKKDGKSLFCTDCYNFKDETPSFKFSKSIDSLDDEKEVIKYWKSRWEKYREQREKSYRKYFGITDKQSGDQK